ncbi:MAG: hypothetical protein VCB26_07470 [Candidatus Hydrogenedentota bacterium]
MLSALGVMGEWNTQPLIAATIPILILGVPIFDFAYIIIVRQIRGETKTLRKMIEHCAPDHLSHRLVWFGFSQRKSVFFIYIMCFVLGISGLLLRNSESTLDSVAGLLQGGSVAVLIVLLMITAEGRHGRGYVVTEDTVNLDLNEAIEEKERVRRTA